MSETPPAAPAISEAVYRLEPAAAARFHEWTARVSGAFVGEILAAEGPVRIALPPRRSRVAGRVPPPPLDPWEVLAAVATAADAAHAAGLRLNGLSLATLVSDDAGGSVGVCLPACVTALDIPADAVPPVGLSGAFAAPEVQRYADHPPGPRSDVFSLAVLFYHLAAGTRPVELADVGFDPRSEDHRLGPAVEEELTDALATDPARRHDTPGALAAALRDAARRDAARFDQALAAAGASSIGLGGRARNEDGFAAVAGGREDGHGALAWAAVAVADGMGGEAAGERASRHAIDGFLGQFGGGPGWLGGSPAPAAWPNLVRIWVDELNVSALALGARLGAAGGFGTTLTGLATVGRWAVLVHLGDSRVYRVRGEEVRLLTTDQNHAQRLHDTGHLTAAQAAASADRGRLVSFLGSEPCSPQVELIELLPGDRFVLASDGAYDGLREADLTVANRLAPAGAVAELLRRARAALAAPDPLAGAEPPSSDNMTVAVLAVGDAPPIIPTALALPDPELPTEPISEDRS